MILALATQKAFGSLQVSSPWTLGKGGSDSSINSNNFYMIEDGRIATNSATGTSCPSTTYTKTITNTQDQIKLPASGSSQGCIRLYFEFELTDIPNDAVITQLDFKFNVTAVSSGQNCDVNPMTTEPSGASASTVWTDIGDGSSYISNNSACASTGAKTITLGGASTTDLQTALSSNVLSNGLTWFAVGLKYNSETRDGSAHTSTIELTETSNSQKPQLKVYFTTSRNVYVIGGDTTDVPDNGHIATNGATGSVCPSGSYTKNGNGSNGNQLKATVPSSSVTSPVCQRVYSEFLTSSINDGTTAISNLYFEGETVTPSSARNCDINPMINQPTATSSASTLWTDIGDGTSYISNNSFCTNASATPFVLELGSSARSTLLSQLNNNWFAIGVKLTNETRDTTTHNSIIGATQSNVEKERIIVETSMSYTNTETITITDAITKADHFTRNQVISISDTATKAFSKIISEAIALSDTSIKTVQFALADFVIVVDNAGTEFTSGFIIQTPFGAIASVILLVAVLPFIFVIAVVKRRRRD